MTSQVYQAQGSPKEIATRASICIAQNLRPGAVNAPQIVSSDLDNGVIVARNAFRFGSLPEWQIRSRFRIDQTGIEMFNAMGGGRGSIGKWWGSPWKKAEAASAPPRMPLPGASSPGPGRTIGELEGFGRWQAMQCTSDL